MNFREDDNMAMQIYDSHKNEWTQFKTSDNE